MRGPSWEYARRKASYSSSVPRLVRSPLTITASGSSCSMAAIAPRFMVSGYGSSPGPAVKTGPTSSDVPSFPHSTSPKCTSLTVAIVVSRRPGGAASVVTVSGSTADASAPSSAIRYVVDGSRPMTRAAWYGPTVTVERSPTRVSTSRSSSVRNVITTSSGPTVNNSGSWITAARLREDGGMRIERVDPAYEADERPMLEQWLEYHRATLALKCEGLTNAQLRERAVTPSTISLLGLVRHMADVERNWFRRVLSGEDAPGLFWAQDNEDGEFNDVDDASVAEAFDAWHAECVNAHTVA